MHLQGEQRGRGGIGELPLVVVGGLLKGCSKTYRGCTAQNSRKHFFILLLGKRAVPGPGFLGRVWSCFSSFPPPGCGAKPGIPNFPSLLGGY